MVQLQVQSEKQHFVMGSSAKTFGKYIISLIFTSCTVFFSFQCFDEIYKNHSDLTLFTSKKGERSET